MLRLPNIFTNSLAGAVFGALVSWVAWEPPDLFFMLWLLPIAWAGLPVSGRRAMMLTYLLTALAPVTASVSEFYPGPYSWLAGIATWIVVALLLWTPWALLARMGRYAGLGWVIGLLLTAVPPLGVIGMASPLFAATAVFPGWGMYGLGATILLQAGLASPPLRLRAAALAGLFAAGIIALVLPYATPPMPHEWQAINTQLGREPDSGMHWIDRQITLKHRVAAWMASAPPGSTVLLPEGIAGTWTGLSALAWAPIAHQAAKAHDTILMGVTLPLPDNKRSDALLALGAHGGVLSARQPVPLSEWNPAARRNFPADWTRLGGYRIGRTHVVLLMCYEQLLVWPAAWAMAPDQHPQIILAPANHGWADSGSVEDTIQRNAAMAWGRLYGVPVLMADNLPTSQG
ncbi:carbon-nitrogen hydrolase family protein [Acidihalobacter prosperus]|uniref:Conjugal transfer protein TraB n=1 Tax=Acidihalobacter prosperus TaxID=160660 RepID=A0A1A6C366_9GAMM|nr:hypothetical protein [Acidihalobacter prosperus]OBS08999.1 hypothetical protein Thpro_022116 [Acidihalobacter prosperus]